MTSTNHPVDSALDFLEAYLSKAYGLEELDDHAKMLQKELRSYMNYPDEEESEWPVKNVGVIIGLSIKTIWR